MGRDLNSGWPPTWVTFSIWVRGDEPSQIKGPSYWHLFPSTSVLHLPFTRLFVLCCLNSQSTLNVARQKLVCFSWALHNMNSHLVSVSYVLISRFRSDPIIGKCKSGRWYENRIGLHRLRTWWSIGKYSGRREVA